MKVTIMTVTAAYIASLFFALGLDAAEMKKDEDFHVRATCKGDVEHIFENRSRADCIEGLYAIEYDWSYKWAECIGQSLEYGRMSGLRASCALIIRSPADMNYVDKISMVIHHYGLPITIFLIDSKTLTRTEWVIK